MSRPSWTVTDYLFLGINPVLIGLMVVSLAWSFVVAVYIGEHGARLAFIAAMFALGTVACCRLTLTEGTGYAATFIGVFGAVMSFAVAWLIEFRPPLGWLGLPLTWLMLAGIAYATYLITQDATVLDDETDATGSGLLEPDLTAPEATPPGPTSPADRPAPPGVSPRPPAPHPAAPPPSPAGAFGPDGLTDAERAVLDRHRLDRMRGAPLSHDPGDRPPDEAIPEFAWAALGRFASTRRGRARRRGRPPGYYVVRFGLGSVIVLGLLQALVPSGQADTRQSLLGLLILHVGSGLGLLLSTSLLNLRRYLRQRRLPMSEGTTVRWLIGGAASLAIVLGLARLLPLPGEVWNPPIRLASVTTPLRETSDWAFGRDGTRTGPSARSTGATPDGPPGGGPSPRPGSPPGGGSGSPGSGSEGSGSAAGGSSGGGSSGASSVGGSSSSESSPGSKSSPSGSDPSGSDPPGSSPGSSPPSPSGRDSSSSNAAPPGGSEQGRPSPGPSTPDGAPPTPRDARSPGSKDASAAARSAEARSSAGERPDGSSPPAASESPAEGPSRESASSETSPENSSSQAGEPGEPASASGSESSSAPPIDLAGLVDALGWGVRMLVGLAIVVGIAVLAWTQRHALLAGWRKLRADLAALWAWLFGPRGAVSPATEVGPSGPTAAPPRPFASYRNPFASGQAARQPPPVTIRETFGALEAWAREADAARRADQTPHEFAVMLGRRFPGLTEPATALARLTDRALYSPEGVAVQELAALRPLWERMTTPGRS